MQCFAFVADGIVKAAKAWENHCEANGKPESHAKAKELL
jgi:hypothetical protein